MSINDLRIILRNLTLRKGYTFINVLGLAIGLAGFGLISLYIYDEYKVDRFHKNSDRIYRVTTDVEAAKSEGGKNATVGRPLAQTIAREVPEVEDVIAIRRSTYATKHKNQYYYDRVIYAGSEFLTSFSFPLIKGDAGSALSQPYTVVIRESIARKYYPDEEAIGKTIILGDTINLTITGIIADEFSSHIDFDLIMSLSTFYANGGTSDQWFTWDEYCYVLLQENSNRNAAEQKISALSMKYNAQQYKASGYNVTHSLQPLSDIYLFSDMGGINRPAGNISQLYILGGIALFILILACINFINLTTARQAERAKEVGVRKTIGASYGSLMSYFFTESFLLVLVGAITAVVLIIMTLPLFNQLTEKQLTAATLLNPQAVGAALLIVVLTAVISGWYPALLLSRFQPVKTLKGNFFDSNRGSTLRKSLVVFQFAISIILIVSTIISVKQLHFMQNQELGFDKEQMLVLDARKTPRRDLIDNFNSIKNDIRSLAQVESVTAAAGLPGRSGWEGQLVWVHGRPTEQSVTMEVIPVDADFTQTLGLKMVSGRGYSNSEYDSQYGMLLNEEAAKSFGWSPDEAVGKLIYTSGMDTGIVLGVMKNYHQHGLQSRIAPIATFIAPYAYGFMAVKLNGGNIANGVSTIEKYWKSRFPGYPFEYFFLDDDFNQQYKTENKTANTFTVFATIAIFIACLGLFGLATFVAEKRRKEVGIRKVLGASVTNVTALLSRDFIKLVLIANVVSWPVAWWAMSKWLQDFEYRIDINVWIFLIAAVVSVLIALITVSFQAVRAAWANPVESIRTE